MAEQEWSTIPASQALPEITEQSKSDLSEPGGAKPAEPGEGTTEPPVQPTPPKRSKRKPAGGATASRPRQAKRQQAGIEIDGEAVSSPAKQKQSTRAKIRQDAGIASPAGGTRAGRSRKKKARVAEPLESAHEFEPDVEATPVKPREMSRAERRAALFSDADPQALPEESGMDAAPFASGRHSQAAYRAPASPS